MARKNKIKVNRNRSAGIRTREDNRGNMRTETFRRDSESTSIAVTTNPSNKATRVFIDFADGGTYSLDGRTARTLYRALQKHYQTTGSSY